MAPVQVDTEAQQQQQQQQQQTQQPSTAYRRCVKITFFCINEGFMIMEAAAGVLGIGSAQGISDSSTVIVGLYMFLFAVILGLYEVIQVWPVTAVDTFYKKNFGFLYKMAGKCGFLVFMAVLCFGLVTPNTSNSTSTSSSSSRCTFVAYISPPTKLISHPFYPAYLTPRASWAHTVRAPPAYPRTSKFKHRPSSWPSGPACW